MDDDRPVLFDRLERFNERPPPFSISTAADLWTDSHTSERMLEFHLDGETALASRPAEFIDRSLEWIGQLARLGPTSRLLDLGCGPGLYTNRLARTGADVVGVDFSERSIRHAERTADSTASPTYVVGDYLEVEVPGDFDVVLLAMYDYCALGPDQRRRLLDRIHAWLRPDGRFIFDVYGLVSLSERNEDVTYALDLMNGFWSAEPYHGFLRTFVYPEERVTLDKYEIIDATRSRTIYNWLQYFDEGSLAEELEAADLVVDAVFGDLAGAPPHADGGEFCVIARRR